MRNFTESELDRLVKGECPACGEKHIDVMFGPGGGLCRNVKMPCGAKMNIPDPGACGWPPAFRFGQMLSDIPPFHKRKRWWEKLFVKK